MKKVIFLSLILTFISLFCLFSSVSAEAILAQGIKENQYLWVLSDYGIYLRTYVGSDYVSEETVKEEIVRSTAYSKNDLQKYSVWSRRTIVSNEKKTLTKTITGILHVDNAWKNTISYSLNPLTKTLTIENPNAVQDITRIFYDYTTFYKELYPYRDYIKNLEIEDGFTSVDLYVEQLGTDEKAQYQNGKITFVDADTLLLETLILGKDVSSIQNESTSAYQVNDQNPYFTVYDGCLYSKDYKCLEKLPYSKDEQTIAYHPNTEVLSASVCTRLSNADGVSVIPWGITTLEKGISNVVYPATVTSIGNLMNGEQLDAWMPYNSYVREYADAYNGQTLSGENRKLDNIDHPWYLYYDITANDWYTTANGKTYYFSEATGWGGQKEPMMLTGKQTINGKPYIFDENGVLQGKAEVSVQNGLTYQDDKVYYYEDGVMQKNKWVYTDDNWYYVKVDGSCYESSWAKINGAWYWFGDSGKMMSNGWLKLTDGKWYYFRSGGQMATGWIKDVNKWYYLTGSGAMVTNKWVKSGSYWYYLGSDGGMLTNTTTPDGYCVDSKGRWI